MTIIKTSEDLKKLKNYFNRKILKIKKENRISKEIELKGHFFKQNNMLEKGEEIFNSIKEKFSIFTFYFDNNDINKKFLRHKNVTFNFMIRYGIQNLIWNKIISEKEKIIHLYCDKRTIKIGSFNSLNEYLISYFNFEKNYNIHFEKVRYFDSKNNWFIQLADICCFYNSKAIRNFKLRKQRNIKKIKY